MNRGSPKNGHANARAVTRQASSLERANRGTSLAGRRSRQCRAKCNLEESLDASPPLPCRCRPHAAVSASRLFTWVSDSLRLIDRLPDRGIQGQLAARGQWWHCR